MDKKQINDKRKEPTVAPGMMGNENLNQAASKEEVNKDEYTKVTTLSYDEVDPS